MSAWPSTRARQVLAALLRIGWEIKRESGTSHRVLSRPGFKNFTFAFQEGIRHVVEISINIGKRCELFARQIGTDRLAESIIHFIEKQAQSSEPLFF